MGDGCNLDIIDVTHTKGIADIQHICIGVNTDAKVQLFLELAKKTFFFRQMKKENT